MKWKCVCVCRDRKLFDAHAEYGSLVVKAASRFRVKQPLKTQQINNMYSRQPVGS